MDGEMKIDFAKVMEKVKQASHEVAARNPPNCEIVSGLTRFTSANTLMVAGQEIKFNKACICPGSFMRPAAF